MNLLLYPATAASATTKTSTSLAYSFRYRPPTVKHFLSCALLFHRHLHRIPRRSLLAPPISTFFFCPQCPTLNLLTGNSPLFRMEVIPQPHFVFLGDVSLLLVWMPRKLRKRNDFGKTRFDFFGGVLIFCLYVDQEWIFFFCPFLLVLEVGSG